MIPLLALVIVAADPLLAVEYGFVLLEVHLLAVVAVLPLVICLRAHVAQPEGHVVRILLPRPEARRLSTIRHILLRADDVLATSQLRLRLRLLVLLKLAL